MMWRQCVALLVVLAWQVISADELVDLIEPSTGWAPQTDLVRIDKSRGDPDEWKLIDNDPTTYRTVRRLKFTFERPMRPIRFRVTVAAHVKKRDLPNNWYIRNGPWTKVHRPAFENGTINLDFEIVHDAEQFQIWNWKRDGLDIAEIELLGTREALDALWPYGTYPCSQRLEMITPTTGPKGRLFSVAKNAVSKKEVRRVFAFRGFHRYTGGGDTYVRNPDLPVFEFDGKNPVIVGVEFSEIPTVHEIMVHGYRWYYREGVEKMVLEGHDCQPFCSKGGSKGWVTLGEIMTPESYRAQTNGEPFYLATPGQYKAYRVKFYPALYPYRPQKPSMKVFAIHFLGCKAG